MWGKGWIYHHRLTMQGQQTALTPNSQISVKNRSITISSCALFFAIVSIFIQFSTGMFLYYLEIASLVGYAFQITEFLTFGFAILLLISNSSRSIPKIFIYIIFLYIYAVLITFVGGYFGTLVFIKKIVEMTYWASIMYIFYNYFRWYEYKDSLATLFFVFHLFLFVLFLVTYKSARSESRFSDVDIVLNSSYYIIFALPLALTCKKKVNQYIAIGTTFIASIISEKRGAIVLVLIITVVWFLFSSKKISLKKKLKKIIFLVLVAFAGFFVINFLISKYNLSIVDRFTNLFSGTDDGSGRLEIWSKCFEIMTTDNWYVTVLGRGYDSLKYSGNYILPFSWAHNDFIQMAMDYGIIGFSMFLMLFVELLKTAKRLYKSHDEYAVLFLISLIVVFLNCIFSMCFIYPYWILGISAFWGLCLGREQRVKAVK